MKRLLFILILLSFNFLLKGQSTFPVPSTGGGLPIKQFLGADSTLVGNKGIFWSKYGDIYGTFTDTTAANLTRIKQYPFARIATTTDQITWVRNKTANKWLTSGQAGGSLTNITTTIHGDTLIQCTTTDVPVCDTLIFSGLAGDTIYNFYFLNDSTGVACDSPRTVLAIDTAYTVQNCDTLHFPPINFLVLQSGLERIGNIGWLGNGMDISNPLGNPNIGPISSWMQRPTTLHTFIFPLNVTGFPVWQPVTRFFQQQGWGLSTDIVTMIAAGGRGADVDSGNRVGLHFGYSGNRYEGGAIDSGYYLQDVGYTIGTNLFGAASYGMQMDDKYSKWATIFIHTKDTTNNESITFYGDRPPLNDLMDDPLQNPNPARLVWDRKIMGLKYNKQAQLYGYGSTSSFISSDTTNNKPQAFDANGNEIRMAYWPGGGGVVAANNGTSLNGGNTVYLGGSALLSNTSILTSAFYLDITSSNTVQTFKSINSANGIALFGSSSSGVGVQANSSSGVALQAFSSTGGGASISVQPSSTNTIVENSTFSRLSSGTAAAGIGQSIGFYNQTSDGTSQLSNQIVSKLTNATTATRTSQFIITGVNSAVTADLFTLSGNGALRLDKYGIGTFTGTPTFTLQTDASGNIIEGTVAANVIATNGLREIIDNTIRLGGTLDSVTTIYTTSSYGLTITGSPPVASFPTVSILNTVSGGTGGTGLTVTSGGGASAVEITNTGSGRALNVTASAISNAAIVATGPLGGVSGSSGGTGNGYGVNGFANGITCIPIIGTVSTTDVTNVLNGMRAKRVLSGLTPVKGIGTLYDFSIATTVNENVGRVSNQMISRWTDVTDSTRTSQFIITGVNNAITDTLMKMGDSVNLTESSATLFAQTTVATGKVAGGQIIVNITANDGTDFTNRTMRFTWVAVNKAGTTTITIGTPEEIVASSSGATLTATITAVDGGSGLVQFKANAVSSLTQTTLRCSYQMSKNF